MRSIEPAQQALQAAVAERLAARILSLDHPVGIPDDEIAGLQHTLLRLRGRRPAAAERVAARDERVQLESASRPRGTSTASGGRTTRS